MTSRFRLSNKFRSPAAQGSVMAEYGLPAMLVGVGLLAIVFGSNWELLGQHAVSTSNGGNVQNKTLMVQNMGTLEEGVLPPGDEPGSFVFQNACFEGISTCLSIPVIQPEADTAGGLGGDAVDQLALVLEQLPQILADLNVDPSVVDRVTKLASMGHDLASQLKAIESVCKRGQVCTGAESKEAKKQLQELKKGPLGEFMSEWSTLQTYLTDNPNAIAAFPEALGIIKGRVNSINTILKSLAAANLYKTVPQTVSVRKTAQCGNGGTWDCHKYVNEVVNTQVFRGLSFQSPGVKKVHQNANDICEQGGNTNRCRVQI